MVSQETVCLAVEEPGLLRIELFGSENHLISELCQFAEFSGKAHWHGCSGVLPESVVVRPMCE
jgi:hypothetical protein